jgi:hypothetical protein
VRNYFDNITNVAVEKGSDLCESMEEIEAMCCGDVDSVPRPVEPITTSQAFGTTAKPPTDSISGGECVSGLVGFTFIFVALNLALLLVCKTLLIIDTTSVIT